MKILARIRDTPDGQTFLERTDRGQYILHQWRCTRGTKICLKQEVTMEKHEVMELLQVLIDEVEVWRRKETA